MPTSDSAPILILMGSNIEPRDNIARAASLLVERFGQARFSRVFETEPVGAPGAPWFLNAAVAISTDVSLRDLKFEVLRPLESGLGRQRSSDRNAPRTIDLDIAICGDLVLTDAEAGLEIPDPQILTSAHVALPLADLEPRWVHPVTRQTLQAIAAELGDETTVRPLAEMKLGGP